MRPQVLKEGTDPDIRKDFLREAALMAMLDHPNIIQLIGVVTIPRDMPPLLVMQLCDKGSLEGFLHRSAENNEPLNDAFKLTVAADVCRGLQYLANHQIIHRDVAARNVLLDAGLFCRIADFGMSLSISTTDKEYVRRYEQFPVRWSAVEVLREGKFSVASDVWAFGVLIHEIMSLGELPYKDLSLALVQEHVTQGGVMDRHHLVSPVIYNTLMLPCWRQDVKARPTHQELLDTIMALGGSADLVEQHHDVTMAAGGLVTNPSPLSVEDPHLLLAPSVYHLCTVLRGGVTAAVEDAWGAHGVGVASSPAHMADTTVWHMVQLYAKPRGLGHPCPRDAALHCAYVDTLAGADDVGRATALLSYSWGNHVFAILDALEAWAVQKQLNPRRTYVWICSLCINQHRVPPVLTPTELQAEFGPRVLRIGRVLPFLDPWHDPVYIKRAWCLFELYTAISMGTRCQIDILLSPKEMVRFKKLVSEKGYGMIGNLRRNISSRNAQASVDADRRAICAVIESLPGSFEKIDNEVARYLQHWAHEHAGAVRTAARLQHATTRSGGATTTSATSAGTSSGDSLGTFYTSSTSKAADSDGDGRGRGITALRERVPTYRRYWKRNGNVVHPARTSAEEIPPSPVTCSTEYVPPSLLEASPADRLGKLKAQFTKNMATLSHNRLRLQRSYVKYPVLHDHHASAGSLHQRPSAVMPVATAVSAWRKVVGVSEVSPVVVDHPEVSPNKPDHPEDDDRSPTARSHEEGTVSAPSPPPVGSRVSSTPSSSLSLTGTGWSEQRQRSTSNTSELVEVLNPLRRSTHRRIVSTHDSTSDAALPGAVEVEIHSPYTAVGDHTASVA